MEESREDGGAALNGEVFGLIGKVCGIMVDEVVIVDSRFRVLTRDVIPNGLRDGTYEMVSRA